MEHLSTAVIASGKLRILEHFQKNFVTVTTTIAPLIPNP